MARKVLICDDEAAPLEAIAYSVRKAGFEVVIARDGAEAVALAREHQPALVLLDLDMPGKDGCRACEEIRADPATRSMRVLVLTAYTQDSLRRKALEAGADEVMTKPFSPRRLRERILELLGGSGAES